MLKSKKSRKLFYRKYVYKIDIDLAMAPYFRGAYNKVNKNLDATRDMINSKIGYSYLYYRNDSNKYKSAEKSNAKKVTDILEKYPFDSFKTRCEHRTLSIYTNDEDLKNDLVDVMSKKTYVDVYEPDKSALKFLLANADVVVVNSEPDMPYKVTLRNKGDLPSIATFLTSNKDNVRATSTVVNTLKRNWYADNQYFYVRTDAMLSLVTMMFSDSIRRVEKLVVLDDA